MVARHQAFEISTVTATYDDPQERVSKVFGRTSDPGEVLLTADQQAGLALYS